MSSPSCDTERTSSHGRQSSSTPSLLVATPYKMATMFDISYDELSIALEYALGISAAPAAAAGGGAAAKPAAPKAAKGAEAAKATKAPVKDDDDVSAVDAPQRHEQSSDPIACHTTKGIF